MTEAAGKKSKTAKDPNTPKKERKPRATSVAVGFAKKIEAKAAEKVSAEAADLLQKALEYATGSAASLLGGVATGEQIDAILTVAIGERVGVSKNGIAAARNVLQPAIAEAMLADAIGA